MNTLQAIVAYNQAGRVGASSIYCAGVASRMVEISQMTNQRRVQPATVIHIDFARFNQLEIQ
jgi:predicted transcriptional regulator